MANYQPNERYDDDTYLSDYYLIAKENIREIFSITNKHINGEADRHTADDVDCREGGTVQDILTLLRDKCDNLTNEDKAIHDDLDVVHNDLEGVHSDISQLQDTKVDKETGKGLSTNDYTTKEKNKLSGIEAGAQKNTVLSVAGRTGNIDLVKSDVGLGEVDNTADKDKPISTAAQEALNQKADTQYIDDNFATKKYVDDIMRVDVGTWRLTERVSGVSAELSVSLSSVFTAESWHLIIDEQDVSGNIGINESFVTAPIIFQGGNVQATFESDGKQLFVANLEPGESSGTLRMIWAGVASDISDSIDLSSLMKKSDFDTDDSGVVDNSERLGGQLPEYYAKQSDLDKKANDADVVKKDELSAELELKADKEDVNASLGLKADKEDVNASLGLKADKEDVKAELELKADKEEVNAALELKANKEDVNASLGLKADKSELDSAMADVFKKTDVIPISKGGTGATTAEEALANLGAAKQSDFDNKSEITLLWSSASSEGSSGSNYTITLASDDYDFLIIQTEHTSCVVDKGASMSLVWYQKIGSYHVLYTATLTVSGNKVSFSSGCTVNFSNHGELDVGYAAKNVDVSRVYGVKI